MYRNRHHCNRSTIVLIRTKHAIHLATDRARRFRDQRKEDNKPGKLFRYCALIVFSIEILLPCFNPAHAPTFLRSTLKQNFGNSLQCCAVKISPRTTVDMTTIDGRPSVSTKVLDRSSEIPLKCSIDQRENQRAPLIVLLSLYFYPAAVALLRPLPHTLNTRTTTYAIMTKHRATNLTKNTAISPDCLADRAHTIKPPFYSLFHAVGYACTFQRTNYPPFHRPRSRPRGPLFAS